MKTTWLVALREIKARWILGPASMVMGVLAMLAIRSINFDVGEADAVLFGAWGVTLVVTTIIGMSLLSDEMSNGRLSFYFTRPFGPRAIFGGKLVGGVLVALVTQAVLLSFISFALPAIAWEQAEVATGSRIVFAEAIAATCASVALGMAAGIVTRSRARWLVVDVACVTVIGVLVAIVVVHVRAAAVRMDGVVVVALAVLFGGLATATSNAVARGRTDRERAHAALSKTLWPIVVPSSAVLVVASLWWL